jgi:hypothetical protein
MANIVNLQRSGVTEHRRIWSDFGFLASIALVALGVMVATFALVVAPNIDPDTAASMSVPP